MSSASGLISPCVGICQIDEPSGLCIGCARTGDEIGTWRDATAELRQAVWDALPKRFDRLGVRCRRLAWDARMIGRFVLDTIRHGTGTWVLGVVGAVGEVPCRSGAPARITRRDKAIEAVFDSAALRLQTDAGIRALSIRRPAIADAPDLIVLARHRSTLRLPVAETVQDLGADDRAIDPSDRHDRLFDLGLGRPAARFCVRTGQPHLIDLLRGQVGRRWQAALSAIGPTLIAESPVRVIGTGLGKAEIRGRIPPADGISPDGPHTHLLPDHLAAERDMPIGLDLPGAYAPGAVFYPQDDRRCGPDMPEDA